MKTMMPQCAGLIALVLITAGCHTTNRYGDARIRNNSDLFTVSYDRFYTRPVSLAETGTNVLQVRNLPRAAYPHSLNVGVTPDEAVSSASVRPWKEALVRIDFQDLAGTVFYSTNLALADAQLLGGTRQLEQQFRSGVQWQRLPANWPMRDYDIVVVVLSPSTNPNHRLELWGVTKL